MCKVLLKRFDIDVNVLDHNGYSPLAFAALRGHKEVFTPTLASFLLMFFFFFFFFALLKPTNRL